MAEYEHREAGYASTMTEQLKGFVDTVIEADAHAKDKAFERAMQVLQAANFNVESVMSLLGIDPGLRYDASLPIFIAVRLGGLIFDEARIDGHMDVHASTSDSSHLKSDTAVDAEGKVGWGPVSVKVKIHSSIGVENERKRDSDYSAGVKWYVLLKQAAPPEGLMKIIDAMCKFQDSVNEINLQLAMAQVEALRATTLNAETQGTQGNAGEE